jgi:hypothetical protein
VRRAPSIAMQESSGPEREFWKRHDPGTLLGCQLGSESAGGSAPAGLGKASSDVDIPTIVTYALPVMRSIPPMVETAEWASAREAALSSSPSCAPSNGSAMNRPIRMTKPYGSSRDTGIEGVCRPGCALGRVVGAERG